MTALEQDPVPHASVAPAPRSQVRTFTVFSFTTCTKFTFVPFGKSGCFSIIGPNTVNGTVVTSSTNTSVWGTPNSTELTI